MSNVASTMLPFLATMWNEHSSVRRCRTDEISFHIVAKNGNNVEVTFDIVERIVQLVAFDNVAWTLLLVWTALMLTSACDAIAVCDLGSRCVHGLSK